jgi:hypothetical protein
MVDAEVKVVEGSISLPYRWVLGPVFTRFFEEFKNKRIMGTKCPKCKRVLVPARKFCPRCFVDDLEWVQVSEKGKVRTWSLINFKFSGQLVPPPYVLAVIDLEGAGTGLSHFIGGIDLSDPEKVKNMVSIGMNVQAKWRDNCQGNILDIEYFRPV